jgi:nucleoside 2-deoxyribosyltransferase
MKEIYIDSTLKHDWNRNFNPQLCSALESKGLACYLPQRDTDQTARDQVFISNKNGMDSAEFLLAVASNESPNWGVEVGYAYGQGKKVIILCAKGHEIPLMGKQMAYKIVEIEDLDDIQTYIDELVAAFN